MHHNASSASTREVMKGVQIQLTAQLINLYEHLQMCLQTASEADSCMPQKLLPFARALPAEQA